MDARKFPSFRQVTGLALPLALLVAAAAPPLAAAQSGPGSTQTRQSASRVPGPGSWEWWNDADVQKEIGLTSQKVATLDGHYRHRSQELAPVVRQYLKESAALENMTRAATVDESTYALQVVTVEALRSKISESRTVMIYRMFRELSPDQYRKLQDIFARRATSRFGRGERGPAQQ